MNDEAALEALNSAILAKVNADGGAFLSHTKLKGRYTLRVAIGNLQTTRKHVRHAYDLICSMGSDPDKACVMKS
jgi:aromatic-L-amino-acid decarboxylase